MTSENRRVISVLVSRVLPTKSRVSTSSLIDAAVAPSVTAIPQNTKPRWIALSNADLETCRILKAMPLLATAVPTVIPTEIPSDVWASAGLGLLFTASIKLKPWSLSRSGRLPKSARGPVSPSWMRSKRSFHNPRNRQWSPSTHPVV